MDLITIFLVAIGLTFDSLAVSISTGLIVSEIKFWMACKIAFLFAVFQGLMPLIGWFLGIQIKEYITTYDHWLAFALLSGLGIKMIYESFQKEKKDFNPTKFIVAAGLALATSIDALVVGVSFAFIEINIILSVIIIGSMTFIVSMSGIFVGKKASGFYGNKIELLGGIILIGIGLKILIEHLLS
jgi:manganese efflux pump family protein